MGVTSGEERVAILLSTIGPEHAGMVLEKLGAESRARVTRVLERIALAGPGPDVVHQVLRDFEDLLWTRPRPAEQSEHNSFNDPATAAGRGKTAGDVHDPGYSGPAEELVGLESARLATALDGEHPRAISLVLNHLGPERAGEVLGLLPLEIRSSVLMQMGQSVTSGEALKQRILRAVAQKARSLARNALGPDDDAKIRAKAQILRALDSNARQETLRAMEQQQPAATARLKEQLYQLRDLLGVEVKTLQKLLAQIDSRTLAEALAEAEEQVRQKVLENLSKRSRETLAEDLQYLGRVPSEKARAARRELTQAIAQLDQAGELNMTP